MQTELASRAKLIDRPSQPRRQCNRQFAIGLQMDRSRVEVLEMQMPSAAITMLAGAACRDFGPIMPASQMFKTSYAVGKAEIDGAFELLNPVGEKRRMDRHGFFHRFDGGVDVECLVFLIGGRGESDLRVDKVARALGTKLIP